MLAKRLYCTYADGMKAEPLPPTDRSAERRKRGPRPRISRESIAKAALDIGIENATVTAVADLLGVDHSSLYRHVKSRAEISALAAEIAVKDMDWRIPNGAGWRDELIFLTDAIWTLYERYPGLADAFRSGHVAPQSGILGFAESVSRLQAKGFGLDEATLAVDMLVDMVCDCFLGWWSAVKYEADGRLQKDRMIEIWEAEAINSPDRAEQINAMIRIMREGPRKWWERKRDTILDGIEYNLQRELKKREL